MDAAASSGCSASVEGAPGQLRILGHAVGMDRLFLLLAPLIYAAFALLTPPFQTPDEQQHLFRAWQLSEFHLIGERQGNQAGGQLPASLGRAALPEIRSLEPHVARKVVARSFDTNFSGGTAPDPGGAREFFDFRGSVIYSPAGYVPQVLAIWLGRPAGLSVENVIRLGRLFNAALTILLIFWAIRLTPAGAQPLMWVGLLPMTASAAASFGQDGAVIGGACLLTAIGLRVAFGGKWEGSTALIAAVVTVGMTLAKILYLPLALIGAVPAKANKVARRQVLVPAMICLVAAVLTALWLQAIGHLVILPRSDIPPPSERLAAWLRHPTTLFMLMQRTFVWNAPYILDTVFKFGWLNVGPDRTAEFGTIVALCLVLLAGDPQADRLGWKLRLWLFLIAIAVVLLVGVTLYLYSRPASDDWVQGFQGRYLIPVAPPLLAAAMVRRIRPAAYGAIAPLLMVGANVLVLRSICIAFYG